MNNYTRNLNRLRGFTDGAGAKPPNMDFKLDNDYVQGYVDGQKAKHDYAERSAKELGALPVASGVYFYGSQSSERNNERRVLDWWRDYPWNVSGCGFRNLVFLTRDTIETR